MQKRKSKRTVRRHPRRGRQQQRRQRTQRRQRGGSYTDKKDATVRTVAGVPITAEPTVVMGNQTLSYKDFLAKVEAAATGQLDPRDPTD